ncbi:hypothetical protein COU76_02920, partial [Candidatus Peregrinibacteria bacterium CG10_big_fil_rev_8_21_14_0_10_49_10]
MSPVLTDTKTQKTIMDFLDCHSLTDIRNVLLSPPEETPLNGASSEEKKAWISAALEHLGNYTELSREEKGLVRQYLQLVTGYSRAQITRHVSLALEEQKIPSFHTETVSFSHLRKMSLWVLGPVCGVVFLAALHGYIQEPQASLLFLNPDEGVFASLHGTDRKHTDQMEDLPVQVSTMMPSGNSVPVAHPLFVAASDTSLGQVNGSGKKTVSSEGVLFATDAQALMQKVEERKEKRLTQNTLHTLLSRLSTEVQDTLHGAPSRSANSAATAETFNQVYPIVGQALHGSASDSSNKAELPLLLALVGAGQEGQILMIEKGLPSWTNVPLQEQLREAAPHGDTRSGRSGGSRGGGGGGSSTTTSTSTTNVTNTTISQAFGWAESDDGTFVYLSTGTDSLGLGTSAPETKLEVIGTVSGTVLHAEDLLSSSGGLIVEGNVRFNSGITLSGVAYTFPTFDGTASGKVLVTDANGHLSWSDASATDILVGRGLTLASSIITLNTNLTGSSLNFITISGATLHGQDLLTSSGGLIVEGIAVFGSGLVLGGVTYSFPTSDGTSSGKVLATDANGNLSWTDGGGTSFTAGRGVNLSSSVLTL